MKLTDNKLRKEQVEADLQRVGYIRNALANMADKDVTNTKVKKLKYDALINARRTLSDEALRVLDKQPTTFGNFFCDLSITDESFKHPKGDCAVCAYAVYNGLDKSDQSCCDTKGLVDYNREFGRAMADDKPSRLGLMHILDCQIYQLFRVQRSLSWWHPKRWMYELRRKLG